MLRIFYIVLLLIKYYTLYTLSKKGWYAIAPQKIIRRFFEDAGGAFIKCGQLLSLRVDVLPDEYMIELINLFDNVKAFSYKDVEEVFLQELGDKPDKIFYDFQKEPFASASFGQVHAAKLTKDHIVAVKVMRPGIEDKVAADFLIIDILAFIGDLFLKIEALPWKEFAQEFKKWTEQELDYRIEFEHAQAMKKNLAKSPDVIIPEVYSHFSTRRILVEDYIEGYPLSRVLHGLKDGRLTAEKLLKFGIDIKKTPRTLIKELLRQFLFDDIFHADPHPGNILLLKDNKIALIDFGIIGNSIVYNKASFVKWIEAGAKMDIQEATYHFANYVGDEMRTMIGSALPASIPQEKIEEFMHLIADHFSKLTTSIVNGNRKNLEIMKKDYTVVFLEILNSARKYHIKLPKEMVIFIRTLTIVGFLAKELDYEFKLAEETKKFFEIYPEEVILKDWDQYSPYKRIGHERAIETLNSWLAYLVEVDPDLYMLVQQYFKQYTLK